MSLFLKQAISALLVGVAVVVFLSVRWPWDLAVAVALMAGGAFAAGWMRTALRDTLLLYAFLFLAVLTAAGVYATRSVPQQWLPVPAIVALGVASAVLGATWLVLGYRASR
jgi:hypothetical protein